MTTPRSITILVMALALLAAACGGGDETDATTGQSGDTGAQTDGGGDGTATADDGGGDGLDDAAGDGSGSSGESDDTPEKFWLDPEDLNFDPAALPTDPLAAASLIDDGRIGGAPEAYPTALYDSCAALDPSVVTDIANEYDGFGVPDFTAVALGPACRYRSQTHVVDIIVHEPDVVRSIAENVVPIAAGEITTNGGTLDDRVVVYTEDSFGIDTPYAWVLTEGDRGVVVRNVAGTGLLIGGEELEQGWEAIAGAAIDGAAGLTAGDVAADTSSLADPCGVFEPADIEAAYGITDVTEIDSGDLCIWEPALSSFSIRITVGNPDSDPFGAIEELGPNRLCCDAFSSGVVYHDPGVVSFSVTVHYPEGEGVSSASNDAALQIIDAIVPRLG